jgi:hypothetical protein
VAAETAAETVAEEMAAEGTAAEMAEEVSAAETAAAETAAMAAVRRMVVAALPEVVAQMAVGVPILAQARVRQAGRALAGAEAFRAVPPEVPAR